MCCSIIQEDEDNEVHIPEFEDIVDNGLPVTLEPLDDEAY